MVDPKGFEPLPRESKSRLLPLQHGSICKSNRIRTYTLGFVNQCAIHYTINLLHSFQDCVCTEREIRTLRNLGLSQACLPITSSLHYSTCGGIRTHMCFARQRLRLFCIPVPSHRCFVLCRGIEPLILHRKCSVLAV